MGKRKGRKSETTETPKDCEPETERSNESEKSGFFACYLLTSLCPRYKGHTYIGFTVDPRRRIRQHNGELCSGAWRTKKKRPWEMVLCIFGFPTNVAALQFEWAWQHPVESLAVRKAAVNFKSLGGLANKIKLAYTMLTLPAWQNLNLTVNFFSTKYTKHYAGCPTLPNHMKVQIRSMDELPCYTDGGQNMYEFENDLWDDDEKLDGTVGSCESEEEERLEDTIMKDLDPAGSENIEDMIPCWTREKGEQSNASNSPQKSLPFSFGNSSDLALPSLSSDSNEREIPSCFSISPERGIPSFCSVLSPIIDVEDCSKESLPTIAADKDEPRKTKHSAASGEVEVIDLFTPSPEYRITSRRKKQAVTVCPQIIDLTQSPIFV